MRTEIETRELVVWALQKSLAKAKSLFAPYAPKFQSVPCNWQSLLKGPFWNVMEVLQSGQLPYRLRMQRKASRLML
jgi:hypothetical protein